MVKAMQYRVMARALVDNDCTPREGKGDHVKWYCPWGKHMAVVTEAASCHPASSATPSRNWPAYRRDGCNEHLQRACQTVGTRLGAAHRRCGRYPVPKP